MGIILVSIMHVFLYNICKTSIAIPCRLALIDVKWMGRVDHAVAILEALRMKRSRMLALICRVQVVALMQCHPVFGFVRDCSWPFALVDSLEIEKFPNIIHELLAPDFLRVFSALSIFRLVIFPPIAPPPCVPLVGRIRYAIRRKWCFP